MKTFIEAVTKEWDEEMWPRANDRPICAWCLEPIVGTEYYRIDGEAVCRDCVEACRQTAVGGR